MMKIRNQNKYFSGHQYWVVLLLFIAFLLPKASVSQSESDKKTIAKNVETLLEQFFNDLLNYPAFDPNDPETAAGFDLRTEKKKYVDSVSRVLLDTIAENYLKLKKQESFSVPNLFLDSKIYPDKSLEIGNLIKKMLSLYTKVTYEDIGYWDNDNKQEYPRLEVFIFENTIRRKSAKVHFQLKTINAYYDTIAVAADEAIENFMRNKDDIQKYIIVETKPVTVTVKWRNLNKPESYYIENLSYTEKKQDVSIEGVINEFIDIFNDNAPSILRNTSAREKFIGLFADTSKATINGSSLFTFIKRNDKTSDTISFFHSKHQMMKPVQLVDFVINNFIAVEEFKLEPEDGKCEILKQYNSHAFVKCPVKLTLAVSDTSYHRSQEKELAVILMLQYSNNLISRISGKKREVDNVRMIAIGNPDDTFIIPVSYKPGIFSYSLNVPVYTSSNIVDNSSAFEQYTKDGFSNNVSFEASFTVNYMLEMDSLNYIGFGTGLGFMRLNSSYKIDNYHFTRPDQENAVGKYTENIYCENMAQSLEYNQVNLPLQFNYRRILNDKSFAGITLGLNVPLGFLTGDDNATVHQKSGRITHTGQYTITAPDGTQNSYLLENIDEYSFGTYDATLENNNGVSGGSVSYYINPSYSFFVGNASETGLFCSIGLYGQIIKNPFYGDTGDYIVGEKGTSYNLFGSGSKSHFVNYGITIGFKTFHKPKEKRIIN
jgi:hypothetical protein